MSLGIFKGATPITDVRIGSTPATAVYLGALKVWPPPPSGGVSPDTLTGFTYWLNAAKLSTLFQDNAGTTPITANGQPVGLINNAGAGTNADFQFNTRDTNTVSYPTYDSVTDTFPTISFAGTPDGSAGNALKSLYKGGWGDASQYMGNGTNGVIIVAAKVSQMYIYEWNLSDPVYARYGAALLACQDGSFAGIRWVDGNDGKEYVVGMQQLVSQASDGTYTPPVGVTRDTWHIYTFRMTSALMEFRVDGGAWQSVANGTPTNAGYDFRVGMAASSSAFGKMKLSDIVTFKTALVDADIASVEQFLAAKVGVTL